MIKNERQYRITRAQAEKMQRALDEVRKEEAKPGIHPLLHKAEVDGLRSQFDDLQNQVLEYEALKSGKHTLLEINSLQELPRALVQARIAGGLSQKDLASKLGLKEQQIQRYEATEYKGASVARLMEVCKALGLNFRKDVFLSTPLRSPEQVFGRLSDIGLEKTFLLKRFLPATVASKAKSDFTAELNNIVFHLTTAASRVFGWTAGAILGSDRLELDRDVLGAARFKVSARAEEKRLSAYTVYAHFLALQLLEATRGLSQKPIPTDAMEVREAVIAGYGSVNFENCLHYAWDLGIPVLPLNDPGAFHGACWRVNGRNVIVLKQQTQSHARWLFDLLHEFWHVGQAPEQQQLAIIEAGESSTERIESDDEGEASQFAGDVVLDGRAEKLVAMCVDATRRAGGKGRLELLKSVLPQIAHREGVATDSLANYMAFRLSLQGENWWGTAMRLQPSNEHPWLTARDALIIRANFSRLSEMDKNLLVQSLTETVS